MSVAAIVVAGGRGERFGGQKQFATLGQLSLTAMSVQHARSVASHVVVVVPSDYAGEGEGADAVVHGGATRSASVRAGLAACGDAEIILVQDAARPLASDELFRRVLDAVRGGADGVVPGIAVTDTIKQVENGVVVATPVRDTLVAVQTPQGFRAEVLRQAHASGNDATDDAALVELCGYTVHVVTGETTNVKVTAPEDLARLMNAGAG